MKEEELDELVGELLEAEAFISSFVVGLSPPAAQQAAAQAASSTAGGLELVGQAVAVDPLAASAAAAAAEGLPIEVVALPASAEGSAPDQLIAAYHPGRQEGQQVEQGSSSTADLAGGPLPFGSDISGSGGLAVDGIAEEELRASVGTGALSLLLDSRSRQLMGSQLQQLLAQVPTLTTASGLTAEAVARSLGLQRPETVAALKGAFGAGTSASTNLADTIQPRPAAQEGDECREHQASSDSSSTFTTRQVEDGLSRLLKQVLHEPSSGRGAASPAPPAPAQSGPASAGEQPTAKQYWQARADAALPAGLVRAWALLEAQAGKQLAALQGRTGLADEVRAARGEGSYWASVCSSWCSLCGTCAAGRSSTGGSVLLTFAALRLVLLRRWLPCARRMTSSRPPWCSCSTAR